MGPFITERAISTLPTVPAGPVNWMFQLFSLAAQEPDFKTQRQGFEIVIWTGAEVRRSQREFLDITVPIVRELGMAVR